MSESESQRALTADPDRVEMSDLKGDMADGNAAPARMASDDASAALAASRGPPSTRVTYDFVMVFKVEPGTEDIRQTIIDTISKAGLVPYLYYSVQQDEVYCRIGADLERLKLEADRIDYDVLLDQHQLEKEAEKRKLPTVSLPPEVLSTYFSNLYAKYDRNPDIQNLYAHHQLDSSDIARSSPFTTIDRLKLVISILKAPKHDGGCHFDLEALVQKNDFPVIAFFPLHDHAAKNSLKNDWIQWRRFSQPVDRIREYFGEKVAIYFAWLEYYTAWLVVPAILGLILFIVQITVQFDNWGVVAYGALMAVWGTLFVEFWKRYNARIKTQWGMDGFEQEESTRPGYKGDLGRSPITGKPEKFYNPTVKALKMLVGQLAVWTMAGVVVIAVLGIFAFRIFIVGVSATYGGLIAAVVNAVQIQILNFVYSKMALFFTNWENYRTETQWEDALVAKTFLFQFINSYISLFYVAFLKDGANIFGEVDSCPPEGCLSTLSLQLGTLFITRIVVGNITEVGIPTVKNYITRYMQGRGTGGRTKSRAEDEFELQPYESTFDDFNEMVIQFGYVTLFVVAFPLAPLIAVVDNLIEQRIDAYKLTTKMRRPLPQGAEDIGTWEAIIEIMSFIAVLTNLAVVVITSQQLDDWLSQDWEKFAFFIVAEHIIILSKFLLRIFIPDVPREVDLQAQRAKYVEEIFVRGVPIEDDEIIINPTLDSTQFKINNTDME